MSSFFIGLTIVGFGTSTPELFAQRWSAICARSIISKSWICRRSERRGMGFHDQGRPLQDYLMVATRRALKASHEGAGRTDEAGLRVLAERYRDVARSR